MTTFAAHRLPDFCARFGVGRSKAYAEIRAGRLQARKLGANTMITEEAAQRWLASLPPLETAKAA